MTPNKTMWTCSPSSLISSPSPNKCLESSSRISNLKIVNISSPMKPSNVSSEYSDVKMGWKASGVVSFRWWWASSNPIESIRMKLMNATTTESMVLAFYCPKRLFRSVRSCRLARTLNSLPSGGGSGGLSGRLVIHLRPLVRAASRARPAA